MIANELVVRRLTALSVAHKEVAAALEDVVRAHRERDRTAYGRALNRLETARERLAEHEAAIAMSDCRAPMPAALVRVRDAIPHGELPAEPSADEVASAAVRLVSWLPVVTEERDELETRLSHLTIVPPRADT